MGVTYFTREIIEAIINIAYELNRMNNLKEQEIYLKNSSEFDDIRYDVLSKIKRDVEKRM